MFRLIGILALGNLLSGGRHHRHAVRRGLLLGALLGYLSNRNFDMNRIRREAHETARKARHTAREAARAFRKEIRNARKASHEGQIQERRGSTRPERNTVRALPNSGTHEAKEIEELVGDLERNAGTAAEAANVPTIDFPVPEEYSDPQWNAGGAAGC